MKNLMMMIFGCVLLFGSNNASAQFTFSVNPGINYNGANFGYKAGIFLPYAGVNYYGGTSKFTDTYTFFNGGTNQMETTTDELQFKGNIILPTIGCRFYFLNTGDLKAYGNVNTTKPIVTAKFNDNGVEDPTVTDYVKRISIWGGEVGFGAEYNFSEKFSISGEFGLRWIAASYKDSHDDQVFNPNTGLTETHPHNIKVSGFAAPTYSKVSLNFYFGSPKNVSSTEE